VDKWSVCGSFDGEFGVETVPVRDDPNLAKDWWLPSYFAQWRGCSIVLGDPIARELSGIPNPPARPYNAGGRYLPAIALRAKLRFACLADGSQSRRTGSNK